MFVAAITKSSKGKKDILRGPPSCLFVPCTPMHAMVKINAEANMVLQDFRNFRIIPEQRVFRILQRTQNVVCNAKLHDGCGC